MKDFTTYLPSLACIVAAGTVAFAKGDGWGWFLLAAIIFHPIVRELLFP